jgi:hypothetical protein
MAAIRSARLLLGDCGAWPAVQGEDFNGSDWRARMKPPRAGLRAAVLLLALLVFLPAGALQAIAASGGAAQAGAAALPGVPASNANSGEDPGASPGKPLLGGVLEWGEDDAAGFAGRLQAAPSVLGSLCGDRGAALRDGPTAVPVPHHPHLTLSHFLSPVSGRSLTCRAGTHPDKWSSSPED